MQHPSVCLARFLKQKAKNTTKTHNDLLHDDDDDNNQMVMMIIMMKIFG